MPRLLSLLVPLVILAGCRPVNLSGESVGQFRVTGTLDETSCGDGYPAPPSSTFYVELRREPDSSYGYWKLPNAPLVAGLLDRRGNFRFTDTQQVTGVEPDPASGVVGCDLPREEVVAGVVADELGADGAVNGDAGAGGALTGTTTIRITPAAGGDCSPLLLPAGGAFPVLPCELSFRLDGERLASPLF